MRVHIIGERKPRPLGQAAAPRTVKESREHTAITGAVMVVGKNFARRLNGDKLTKTKNGTIYGYFSDYWKAAKFIADNKMDLYTAIVAA